MAVTTKVRTVNLYGEDGIAIGMTKYGDICHPSDDDCSVRVVGYSAYPGSTLDEAHSKIAREYLRRIKAGDAR